MEKKIIFTLLLALMLTFSVLATLPTANIATANQQVTLGSDKWIDPELYHISSPTRVIAVVEDKPLEILASELSGMFYTLRFTPPIGGARLVLGTIDHNKVSELAQFPSLMSLMKDRPVEFNEIGELPLDATLKSTEIIPKFRKNRPMVSLPKTTRTDSLGMEKQQPMSSTGLFDEESKVHMSNVTEIVGVKAFWDLDYNGTDITIAIVDTGVDYGAPGLGYWANAVAKNSTGYPTPLDADGICFAYTNITLTAYTNATGTYIPTNGLDPFLYDVAYTGWGAFPFSYVYGPFDADMDVTGILNDGDTCHWGVMLQWNNLWWSLGWVDLYPILVVDSDSDSIYETAYVDLSFDYCSWFGPWPPDYSFTDETPVTTTGWTVAARDFTTDGIYDISVGSLGHFLDVWGASPNPWDRGLVLQPIDPAGNYVCFENDPAFGGHGTLCAHTAAGRNVTQATGFVHPYWYPGMAPDAHVMGIIALFYEDIIEGQLWAAGFDLIPASAGWSYIPEGYLFGDNGWYYGVWNYTGNHKADIISNSWGYSAWAPDLAYVPLYDILTILQDSLSIPGYLDPDYPGTLICHSAGNGGSGYGTATPPGYGALELCVGASTSMNWTSDPDLGFGFAGGYYDDVISWSARGPPPKGYPKPDILAVGAYGFTPAPVWYWGYGPYDGTAAYELFGGTSMACPEVAGFAALIEDAYLNEVGGGKPTPEQVKLYIKSSAKDLNYDAFLQGSGRIDGNTAISTIRGSNGILVRSNATWDNLYGKLVDDWSFASAYYPTIPSLPPSPPIDDVSWYAGTLLPGESSAATFELINPTSNVIDAEVDAVTYEHMADTDVLLSGVTHALPTDWNSLYWENGDLVNLVTAGVTIPADADLMTVSLVVSYQYFDPDKDYNYDYLYRLCVHDWDDLNNDTYINVNEVWTLNYGFQSGTSIEVPISSPSLKFQHIPTIFIAQALGATPVPYEVYIRFWKRVPWDWITPTTDAHTVPAGGSLNFAETLNVPPLATQGVYQGFILVNYNYTASTDRIVAIPVSVDVPVLVPTDILQQDLTPSSYATRLYDPYSVEGYFDWRWRYESGDWKIWELELQDDPEVIAAFVNCNWTGEMTDIDMFAVDSSQTILDHTGLPWHWSGIFEWATRTGGTDEWVGIPPLPGVHSILLHNVLYDGTTFPEPLHGYVGFTRLSPRQIEGWIVPGGIFSTSLNLSTGHRLTNVNFEPTVLPSGYQVSFTPSAFFNMTKDSSEPIHLTIKAPYNATGNRLFTFNVSSEEMATANLSPTYTTFEVLLHVALPVGGTVTLPNIMTAETSTITIIAPCVLISMVMALSILWFRRRIRC